MPTIAHAYTLFIEGVVQIVIGLILMIFVLRRGKNRMMWSLSWFFIAVGIFSLQPFLPSAFEVIPGLSFLVVYSSLACHTSVFFGVAGYCGAQFGLFKRPMVVSAAYGLGFLVAISIVVLDVLSLPSIQIDEMLKMEFMKISEWALFGLLIAALAMILAVFVLMAWQMRKQKGAVNYATSMGLGITLLLAALTIRKALDTFAPNLFVDLLTFVSFILVVIGISYQTSSSMSPGMVYDDKTKKPINHAFVRLFTPQYNKLVESRVTDDDGRYGLLVEPGTYKLSVLAPGYKEYQGETFNVAKPMLVGRDISLQKNTV